MMTGHKTLIFAGVVTPACVTFAAGICLAGDMRRNGRDSY